MKPITAGKKRRANPEAHLQSVALTWLKRRDILAWRMPLGPVLKAGGVVFARNPLAGFPDVAGILRKAQRGRLWAVEFKSPKGRLRENQVQWITTLRDAGCAVTVVRYVGELEDFFRELGEIV